MPQLAFDIEYSFFFFWKSKKKLFKYYFFYSNKIIYTRNSFLYCFVKVETMHSNIIFKTKFSTLMLKIFRNDLTI